MVVDQYGGFWYGIRKRDFSLGTFRFLGFFGLVSILLVGEQCIDGTLLVLGSALCCLDELL